MSYDPTFVAKIFPALMTAFDDTFGSIYSGRVYASVAPTLPSFPYLVYQSQDGGGVRQDYLDQNGWNGLITFRSVDTTLSGAWSNALSVVSALQTMTVSGFSVSTIAERPQWFPVEKFSTGYIYTAGIIVNFTISNT